jgi:hypothetical protein
MPAPQQVRRNPAQRPGQAQQPSQRPVQQQRQAPPPQPVVQEAPAQEEDPFAQQGAQAADDGYYEQSDAIAGDLPDVINLEDAPDAPERVVIPAGLYQGYVDTVDYGPSNAGDPMLTWLLRVVDPTTGEEVPLYFWTSFGEKAIGYSKKTLKKLAPDLDFRNFDPHAAQEMFSGMNVRIRVRVKTNGPNHAYPGKQNEVRDIEPLPESFLQS